MTSEWERILKRAVVTSFVATVRQLTERCEEEHNKFSYDKRPLHRNLNPVATPWIRSKMITIRSQRLVAFLSFLQKQYYCKWKCPALEWVRRKLGSIYYTRATTVHLPLLLWHTRQTFLCILLRTQWMKGSVLAVSIDGDHFIHSLIHSLIYSFTAFSYLYRCLRCSKNWFLRNAV